MAVKPPKSKTSRRKANTARKRLTINPETIAQHSKLLGRSWTPADTAQADTLGIIHDRGYITSDQRDAGRDFAALYNRFFPVHERAAAIGGMAGKGSIGMPAAFQDEEDELKYKRLRRLTAALSSHNDILIELAVCDKLPIWINRAIQEETIKHKQIERWRRDTLNSFAPTKTKSILQQNKEVNKKAARLQAVIRNHSDFVMEPYEQRHLDRLTEGLEILVRGSKKGS
ncbi:hypothetical protein [Paremcibacter congregatus]|uniref:hypothetical protein n=1 Tax=Paremcibacter congregatus TaxID=2043170 RepID=UPI0030EEA743|tara:strand:- start:1500 stop:2183 length:684 start_codon:yes stop_codon:yes gene_type:complete